MGEQRRSEGLQDIQAKINPDYRPRVPTGLDSRVGVHVGKGYTVILESAEKEMST